MKKPTPEVYHPANKAAREADYARRLSIVQALPVRVCNASSTTKLTGMVMLNDRTSQADQVASRGQPC